MSRFLLLLLACFISTALSGQEIFKLDFEDEFVPEEWEFTHKSEWCHVLGENGSSFFRFHPFSWRDVLQTPNMDLEEGYYVLYFSWNEAGRGNPDFCNIRIRENDNDWQSLDRIGVGNERVWQKDSTIIGNLSASNYTLEFEYKSLGHYPSEYLNLDNIFLVRRDIVTGISESLTDIDFSIYPNPVQSILTYTIADPKQRIFDMQIINSLGQIVMSEKAPSQNESGHIEVAQLPAGMYILEFKHEEGSMTKRFIIQ